MGGPGRDMRNASSRTADYRGNMYEKQFVQDQRSKYSRISVTTNIYVVGDRCMHAVPFLGSFAPDWTQYSRLAPDTAQQQAQHNTQTVTRSAFIHSLTNQPTAHLIHSTRPAHQQLASSQPVRSDQGSHCGTLPLRPSPGEPGSLSPQELAVYSAVDITRACRPVASVTASVTACVCDCACPANGVARGHAVDASHGLE